jgi:hypothetical protein
LGRGATAITAFSNFGRNRKIVDNFDPLGLFNFYYGMLG